MKKFKNGDRVKIIPGTEYYNKGSNNPKDVVGTITQDNRGSVLKYKVSWDNGGNNTYGDKDLELTESIVDNYQIY